MQHLARWTGRVLGAVAAFSCTAPAFAQNCTVRQAVGRIDVIERSRDGDVQIVRASGKREPAEIYHYLCPGDTLRKTGSGADVGIRWDGRSTLEFMPESVLQVGTSRSGGLSGMVGEFFERLGFLNGSSRARVPTTTRARSGSGDATDPVVQVPFSHDFAGEQLIALNRDIVALPWQGEAMSVRLSENDGRFLSASSVLGQPWTVIRTPAGIDAYTLEITAADRSTHMVGLRRSAAVPEMPGVEDVRAKQQQLLHALWLAYDAGPQWRLEGLSRLRELAQTSLAAEQAWNSIVAGEAE